MKGAEPDDALELLPSRARIADRAGGGHDEGRVVNGRSPSRPNGAADGARSVDELQVELVAARARLQESLAALQVRFDELTDWRAWVRRHPFPFLLGAAALGAWLGWSRTRKPPRWR